MENCSDEYGNKYYKNKKDDVGLFTRIILKQLELLQNGICGCIILTKFLLMKTTNILAKKHLENQTGTNNSFKPVRIRKTISRKIWTWK